MHDKNVTALTKESSQIKIEPPKEAVIESFNDKKAEKTPINKKFH